MGGGWRGTNQTAGYQGNKYQEFGQGKSSVKLHHNPGGASNFSLADGGGQDERFDRIKPGVSQPFGRKNYDVDETYHQKTAIKNQSQIAFGNDASNPYQQHQGNSFASYTRALEQDEPKYPKKKPSFNNEDAWANDQYQEPPGY